MQPDARRIPVVDDGAHRHTERFSGFLNGETMSGSSDKLLVDVQSQKEAVMIAPTRPAMSVSEPTLYVAFELGKKEWKLAMTAGFGVQPWLRTVTSRDWGAVDRAIAQGRARFGLTAAASVVSCYEAGRDG
ncbi:MAG TPA: hypothetical protein VFG86_16975, partial [Chloroflexota bacterium]|nr:hypothetical protein [Chloroflexota bacterium]